MKLDLKRPHQRYFSKSGEQVPGVTTVLGVYAKEALMGWYAAEERDGVLAAMGDGVWSAPRLSATLPRNKEGKPSWFAVQKRDKAADLGTVAHAHIEARLKGESLDRDGLDPDLYVDALLPAERFFEWVNREKVTLVASELQLVSDRHQIGGTGDTFWRGPDGKLEYWDVKTSKPWYGGLPYDEQVAQSSAYADFYWELNGERVERIRIARVGKTAGDSGDFFPISEAARDAGMHLFELAAKSYRAKRRLSDALKSGATA